jgi:predicted LPLAT superfamily acyltransferase
MSERKWSGKSKGGKTGHEIFILLLKYFGLIPAYTLLYFVSAYYFLTSWKSNKSSYFYFRMLGYGKVKSILSIYKNYYIFGQTLIDRISAMVIGLLSILMEKNIFTKWLRTAKVALC